MFPLNQDKIQQRCDMKCLEFRDHFLRDVRNFAARGLSFKMHWRQLAPIIMASTVVASMKEMNEGKYRISRLACKNHRKHYLNETFGLIISYLKELLNVNYKF